ncbi:MAG TPA: outer membrane protein assembly factor BamB family protein [Candidatus Azoamicus sp. MARI]
MLVKNVINFYIKILNNIFIFFIFIFFLSSSVFCYEPYSHIKKYNSLSFNKNKFYRYSSSELYVMSGKAIYKKTISIMEKEFEFSGKFKSKGFVINDKYLVIYGLNNIEIINRQNGEIISEKKFTDNIILRPLIYLNSLFICLDYDTIVSIDILSGNLNWQYKNDVFNLQLHTNTKFIQSENYLFYINSNRMHMIEKETGLMYDRISVAPRHKNATILKNPRIACIELYNDVLYICYDDGILLAFDTKISSFLWQNDFSGIKNFIVYKRHILAVRENGLISLISKVNGAVLLDYSNLIGKNLKKIILLNNKGRFLILGDKSIFVFTLYNKKLYFGDQIFIKTDDIIKTSCRSFFLLSKNKILKEYIF